jgi:hypothetical protein
MKKQKKKDGFSLSNFQRISHDRYQYSLKCVNRPIGSSDKQLLALIFGWWSVRFSAGALTVMNQELFDHPQYVKFNVWMLPLITLQSLPSTAFQFIVY